MCLPTLLEGQASPQVWTLWVCDMFGLYGLESGNDRSGGVSLSRKSIGLIDFAYYNYL